MLLNKYDLKELDELSDDKLRELRHDTDRYLEDIKTVLKNRDINKSLNRYVGKYLKMKYKKKEDNFYYIHITKIEVLDSKYYDQLARVWCSFLELYSDYIRSDIKIEYNSAITIEFADYDIEEISQERFHNIISQQLETMTNKFKEI